MVHTIFVNKLSSTVDSRVVRSQNLFKWCIPLLYEQNWVRQWTVMWFINYNNYTCSKMVQTIAILNKLSYDSWSYINYTLFKMGHTITGTKLNYYNTELWVSNRLYLVLNGPYHYSRTKVYYDSRGSCINSNIVRNGAYHYLWTSETSINLIRG